MVHSLAVHRRERDRSLSYRGPGSRRRYRVKRAADVGRVLHFEHHKLHAKFAGGACELSLVRVRARVGQHGDPPCLWRELMQDFEPFDVQLRRENADPGRVAARPRHAGREPAADHVISHADDGNRLGCALHSAVIIAGSPLAYWSGVHRKNPMRYSGGLLGGSWLTLTSDLGGGKFDGAWLVQNFENQNPANTLWTKQYNGQPGTGFW
jgi:Protein of unknown function (DUF3141)